MRLHHGKYYCNKKELWSLDYTMAKVLHDMVKQFRDSERVGVPSALEYKGKKYIIYDEYAHPNEKLGDVTEDGYILSNHETLERVFNAILDDIILTFKMASIGGYDGYLLDVHIDYKAHKISDKDLKPKIRFLTDEQIETFKKVDYLSDEFRELTKVQIEFMEQGLKLFTQVYFNLWD